MKSNPHSSIETLEARLAPAKLVAQVLGYTAIDGLVRVCAAGLANA